MALTEEQIDLIETYKESENFKRLEFLAKNIQERTGKKLALLEKFLEAVTQVSEHDMPPTNVAEGRIKESYARIEEVLEDAQKLTPSQTEGYNKALDDMRFFTSILNEVGNITAVASR